MNHANKALLTMLLLGLLSLVGAHFAAAVEVGDKAADFELDSTKGGKLKLSSLRGKNILIHFYRSDFDPT